MEITREERMQDFRTVAVAAAQQAGKLIADAYRTDFRVDYKQGTTTNLVTEVDRRSEAAIIEALSKAFPDHRILAEEGGEGSQKPSSYKWIVDPLDGTTNFAHGFPAFCVSIGLEVKGRVVLGVVYDPLRQELFEAQAGQGAFLNGERLRVSRAATLDKALLVTGFAYDQEGRRSNLDHFSRFALRAQGIRRTGSAAIDLCYVASGRIDGFWEMKLFPWDVAAGSLIVAEAGGRVTDFADRAFSIYGHEVLASNGLVHQAMIEVLAER
jgi:myo-inositol-1(or 4)-monophosphatase